MSGAWSGTASASPSDKDLMARLAAGDREALAPLMERHHRRVYAIALGYLRNPDDALDVVQETFVRAFQHAGRWEPAIPVLPWITRIAVNQAIDRYRRLRRRRRSEEPLAEGDHQQQLRSAAPSPEQRALGGEVGERIRAALEGLPAKQRAVFVLRHYQDQSLHEIGETLGMTLGTVKSSLHRAVQRMRVSLSGAAR